MPYLSGYNPIRSSIAVLRSAITYFPSNCEYTRTAESDNLIVVHFKCFNYTGHRIESFTPNAPGEYQRLFEELLDCWKQKAPDYQHQSGAIFYRILSKIFVEHYACNASHSKIEPSLQYIRQNMLHPDFSLETAARASFVSDVYFRKLFKEIHGISPAMVKNQPSFEEIFPMVKEILYKSKLVIAYNIEFEMNFLWGFDLTFGKPGGTQLIKNVVWGPDPMLMYSAYKGTERWQKLSSAAKHFKYQFNAHDSLEDVKATLHCYKKLIEYVKNNPDKDYIIKYGFLYESGKKVTEKPEILFQRLDIAEVMKKVEELHPPVVAEEEKVEENVIDIEPKEEITFDDWMKLQFQVGEIIACEEVKKSKKLLCSQVKIGSQVKQIVSGIKGHYTAEEMVGKKVMVLVNLKPAKLAGILSEGMLLCAEDADGNLALMTPEKPMPAGAEIA